MEVSPRGFYRPSLDRTVCKKCGICKKVCPFDQEKLNHYDINTQEPAVVFGNILETYAGWSLDEDIRLNSASGGIATALAEALLEKRKISAYAATYWEEQTVKVNMIDDVKKARHGSSSKYAPTEFSEVARYIRKHPKANILVVGLPCQIAGLKNLCELHNLDNVLLIDLLCGRMMSQLLLQKLVDPAGGLDNIQVNFRDKSTGWFHFSLSIKADEQVVYREIFRESSFGRCLNAKLFTQPACFQCPYSAAGLADITLGDYWSEEYKEVRAGVSLVASRTLKGEEVLKEVAKENFIKLIYKDKACLPQTQPHFFVNRSEKARKSLIAANNQAFELLETGRSVEQILAGRKKQRPIKRYLAKIRSLLWVDGEK